MFSSVSYDRSSIGVLISHRIDPSEADSIPQAKDKFT